MHNKTYYKPIGFVFLLFISGFFGWNLWTDKSYRLPYVTTPCVLFDFDGTLVDSFDIAVNACNQLADEFGFAVITDEQKRLLRHMSTKDIITKHLKIPWYRLPFLQKKVVAIMANHIPHLSLMSGMEEVLIQLKAQGYRLAILSSNSEEGIKNFLKKNNITVFDDIYAGSSLFGKHRVIKQFLSAVNVDPQYVMYVGDEVRDIEATVKAGIRIIAVDWGLDTRETLLAYNPHKIISHPSELIGALVSSNYLG